MAASSDYEDYFSEPDEEVQRECDRIESTHNSPVKGVNAPLPDSFTSFNLDSHILNHNRMQGNLNTVPGSPSNATWPPANPKTPSRKWGVDPQTPASRRIAVDRAFSMFSPEQSPTPRKLFPGASKPSTKKKKPRKVVDVSDDDDADTKEVESELLSTDTDTEPVPPRPPPISTQNSLSSIGSDWSIPSFSSFRSPTAGDPGSPSKYRKLSESPANDDVFGPATSRVSGWETFAPAATTLATPPEDDAALKSFLAGPLGLDLDAFVIAHDKEVVALMDKEKISWGVQWELARGVTERQWSWAAVKDKIHLLCGSSSNIAPRVRSMMLGKPPKTPNMEVWKELDREQDAIMENRDRGLGLMGPWKGDDNWYGGQVQQLARIILGDDGYKIRLEPMEKRRSYRLARFLSSRRILQLRVPKELVLKENAKVKGFMRQKFILCGRVFVPFFAKDHATYLVETDDNHERKAMAWCGDKFRRSFKDIINWHNRLDLNVNQPITKYATRFALALSTSIPAVEFLEKNIFFIDDLIGDYQGIDKPPAEYILTDGCGYINKPALVLIARVLNYFGIPTAVQGRIMGAKGLWIVHPTDTSLEPKIWIRSSQRKIDHPSPLHRSHLILDLLSVSHASTSVSLSKQSIMNLSENGVSDATLTDLMKQALTDEVRPLMKWEGPYAMEILWSVVNKLGSVSRQRLTRVTAGLSRALGLQGHDWGGDEIELEKDNDTSPVENELGSASVHTGRGLGGAPASLSEITLELLQAGFVPTELKLLKDKIRYLVETAVISSLSMRESIAEILSDPLGILKEGEVYYYSSAPFLDSETQTPRNVVVGDVLAKAVYREELFKWQDVLIVSTMGRVSFASYLSGGDTVFILREKSLVEPFKSKPVKRLPLEFMDDNFQKHPERVKQFAERVSSMSLQDVQKSFSDILMLGLDDAKFGLYSNFQDFAIWKHGYGDIRSERLAYIFNALLDSNKTGDRLKTGIFEKDQKKFGHEIDRTSQRKDNIRYIFHTLQDAGKAFGEELLCEYEALTGSTGSTKDVSDKALLQPYDSAANKANKMIDESDNRDRRVLSEELDRIRKVVDNAHVAYKEALRKLKAHDPVTPSKKSAKAKSHQRGKPDPKAQACDKYDDEVKDIVFFQNIEAIKASYAYKLDPGFGFTVAFRDLCTIKASTSPHGIAPTIRSFDEAKHIPSTYIKAVDRLTALDT
ncbi:hypothetical protein DXG01_008811 [Tephrocybe rancida]|nr:hypothetical protein DXG01_008811 [Tephrocybe rancida]